MQENVIPADHARLLTVAPKTHLAFTGIPQLNLGSYAGNMQFGVNYTLGKNRIAR